MTANRAACRPAITAFALSPRPFASSGRPRPKRRAEHWTGKSRSSIAFYLGNCLLCAGLWISLIAAIWMSRGWIGLLFSGQVLSAGVHLFQRLARRTQYAFAPCGASASRWEGKQNAQ
jgi:hypothetical protein